MSRQQPANQKEGPAAEPAGPTRSAIFLAHAIAYSVTFLVAKAVCVAAVDASWSKLPWLLGGDLLIACLAGLIACRSQRVASLLVDVLLLYYAFNIHFALVFGDFVHFGLLSFASGSSQMFDSFLAVADWRILGTLAALIASHRLLTRMMLRRASALGPEAARVAGGAMIAIALALLGPDLESDRIFRHHPLSRAATSVLPAATEIAATGNIARPDSGRRPLGFDGRSSFESEQPEAPPEVRWRPGQRFNVIVVLLESTSNASRLRKGAETMPNFARLMEHGVYFPNHYANVPLSIKSLFALHTGHYPAANMLPISRVRPQIPLLALPQLFKREGYRNALLHGGHFSYTNKLAFLSRRGYDLMHDAADVPGGGAFESTSWGIDDKAIFDFAREWITGGPEPFFLTIIPLLPHHPYKTPERWERQFGGESHLDHYHDSLYFEDELLGELMQSVRDAGLEDSTLFVVAGDHGEAFKQHKRNQVHSGEVYEENVNVPLVISNPLLFPTPQVSTTVGALVDLFPTIAELAGLDLAEYRGDGVSLLRSGDRAMTFFYGGIHRPVLGVRDGRFKFVYRPRSGRTELYDLEADPGETRDLSEAYPERVDFYRERVKDWQEYSIAFIDDHRPEEESDLGVDLTTLATRFQTQSQHDISHNRAAVGGAFRSAGKIYDVRGIGTHTDSILTFDVSEYSGSLLKTRIGVHQRRNRAWHDAPEPVRAQIWIDGEVVFDSGLIRAAMPPLMVSLPIDGRTLSLVSIAAPGGFHGEGLNWLEPRIVRP